ncbi:hypothetical protein BACCIP111899_01510 [Bacillus rhizoplanae]|uniref:Uncharacterized protein n=1 Tax=Bacillus rhizoplanae TaxID=2880966 RepID=A0ABM8Y9B0_9BACI|nr:hypothetical protein [Bacillus rhizoplanae]CAG9612337.1 hypothetical protein BACCIP111899_01510 [Bacillus rhizoplanae]
MRKSKAIKEKQLSETILNDLSILFEELKMPHFNTELLKQFKIKRKLIMNLISSIEIKLKNLNQKKLQYYDLFVEEEISKEELEELREMIMVKISDFQNQIINLNS